MKTTHRYKLRLIAEVWGDNGICDTTKLGIDYIPDIIVMDHKVTDDELNVKDYFNEGDVEYWAEHSDEIDDVWDNTQLILTAHAIDEDDKWARWPTAERREWATNILWDAVQARYPDIVRPSDDEEEGKIKLTKIKITDDAYLCTGYYGEGMDVLDEWYEASAKDIENNEYTVIWKIKNKKKYDPRTMPEDMACDWDKPWDVVNDNGKHVTDSVIIIRPDEWPWQAPLPDNKIIKIKGVKKY